MKFILYWLLSIFNYITKRELKKTNTNQKKIIIMATKECSCYHSYPAIEAALQAGAGMTISYRNGRGLCEVRIEKGEKVLVCVEGFRVQIALQRANQELLVGLVDLNEISKDRFDSYIFLWKVTRIFFHEEVGFLCRAGATESCIWGSGKTMADAVIDCCRATKNPTND